MSWSSLDDEKAQAGQKWSSEISKNQSVEIEILEYYHDFQVPEKFLTMKDFYHWTTVGAPYFVILETENRKKMIQWFYFLDTKWSYFFANFWKSQLNFQWRIISEQICISVRFYLNLKSFYKLTDTPGSEKNSLHHERGHIGPFLLCVTFQR